MTKEKRLGIVLKFEKSICNSKIFFTAFYPKINNLTPYHALSITQISYKKQKFQKLHLLRGNNTEEMQAGFHYESKGIGEGYFVGRSRVVFFYYYGVAVETVVGTSDFYQVVRNIMRFVFGSRSLHDFRKFV